MQQRLPHSDERRHCRRPAGVVLMIMRQNQPVDLVNPNMPQIRHDNPFTDIKIILNPQRPAGIHQNSPAIRRDN